MQTDEIGNKTSGAVASERLTTDEHVKIGYIGGGSRGWAYTLINDLAQCSDISGEVALYDVDYEGAKRNERFGNWVQERSDAVGDWTYTAVQDRETALVDADFVVLSTQDPPDETFAHELDIPAEYGIHQTVGDTVGPGGIVRAMRTIPVYRDIAAAVREHCPEAWVLNYTNPMTVCTQSLYEEFPDVKAIGLCHEVFHGQEHLASLVVRYRNVEQPPRRDIEINVKGINHFTWVDSATWRGEDLLPLVERHLQETIAKRSFDPGDLDGESWFVDNQLVAYELYRRFGRPTATSAATFPAAGDRHLMEFAPWFLNVDDPAQVQRWGVRLTPSEYRRNRQEDALAKFRQPMTGEEPFEFFESGEEGVDIMRALLGLGSLKTNVNLPNRGQIPDLPDGAVVETNALVETNEIRPLEADTLPPQVRSLILTHVSNQKTLVDAAFAGDVDLAFRAFLNDPLVTLQPDRARALFSELVAAVEPYLTDHWNLADAIVLE
ncbi:family 4 glycosyl hydrolase [Halegenticoccus tardaugens]|uniref:family 4 glycosyl hydrolase n=1 Tax=Halegenticoccus tardaugens TaxID=2071624 RepID=UPI00100A97D0|nr:glycoside hydrolase family 4 [Halegenticoccus tardaugens]